MSVSNMQDFFTIIGNFGFPVAVAGYLLFRFEKKLESLEAAERELNSEIKALKEEVAHLNTTIVNMKKRK